MERIDENGTWQVEGNCELLLHPSEKWISENQPPKTQEETDVEKLENIRTKRNNLLVESDFVIQRHIEQKELVILEIIEATTLIDEKYNEWLEYRQLLRDITVDVDLDNPLYPIKPE
jgi:hypothetical protein